MGRFVDVHVGSTAEAAREARLVARFAAGDAAAMNTLFELHVDRVYAYARHLLGNSQDAEEVTSEAFLRAFEKCTAFRGDSPFRGWLFGITRNLCIDRLRQPRLLLLEPEEASRVGDAGRAAAGMETSVAVAEALESLSEDARLVLLLCDVQEWDASEAAAMMERTVSATKSLLYRARRALKSRLTDLLSEGESSADEM